MYFETDILKVKIGLPFVLAYSDSLHFAPFELLRSWSALANIDIIFGLSLYTFLERPCLFFMMHMGWTWGIID